MPHVNIAAAGTTKAPRKTTTSSANRDGPIGVLPAPATKDGLDDNHIRGRRRMFIGPMPENVAARLRAAPALSAQGNGTSTSTNGFAPEDFAHDDIADDSDSSSSCSGSRECSGSESDVPEEVERGPNRVSRKRLLRAFLSKGGNREQFSEREIRRRWRAGGWSRVPLPPDASARRWVGTSFEVGVDVVAGMSENARQVAVSHPLRDEREGGEGVSNLGRAPVASRTTTAETFVTARSSTGPKSDEEESEEEPDVKPRLEPVNTSVAPPKSPSLGPSQSGEPSSRATSATHRPDTPVSSVPLLSPRAPKDTVRPHSTLGIPNITLANSTGAPQTVSESHLPGALSSQKRSSLASKDTGLRSALRRNFSILKRGSTQQRSVVFAESPQPLSDNAPDPFNKLPHSASAPAFPSRQPVTNRVPSDSPARPIEVLNREAEPADTTSAGAAVALQAQQNRVPDDGIILRDRMLVRAAFNRSPGLPKPFDEAEARRHPDTQEVQWREMLVVWRRNRNGEDRVELYQDYTTPGKERILGHKDLAFVVPLSEAATSISLYSHVDLTFCLTCPPTPVRTGSPSKRARFHRAPIGTNIFVCKVKSRTRALNWIWNLWRYLGGELPETIDIHCPALGTRVRVDIPDLDRAAAGDSWKRFTRPYLIEACGRSLRGLPDWDAMMESPVLRGARLELAWRKESKLDWVWQETDEQGMEIDWQVLFGLALRQPSLPSQLEIRLGLHSPTHVSLTDGTILEEPLAVEGYLHRIKPKTLTRTNVYLTSHDGYLFTLRYADAEPPTPPVLFQAPLDDVGHRAARERELRRGRCMILDADGYIDLRSIMAIRRAVELTPPIGTIDIGVTRSNPLASDSAHDEEFDDQWVDQEDASDNEDEGGEDYLSKSDDKMRLKMKRSFELIMRSGRVVRFETYSRKTCLEWIARLRDLTKYWTRRHRVDARDEMELVFATQGRARFTIPKLGQEEAPEGWVPDGASPYLAKFWNWCVLEGCRVIVKAGRLYTKTGIRKQFKHDFHVLTGGHIMLFHITPNAASYHRHSQTINLADAYVYSGQIAMRSLPRAAGVDSRQKIPRRYQDGLESDDSEEDTTFIIWYRPHSTHKPLDPLLPSNPNSKGDPLIAPLSGKHKTLICKARSRLERDAWCWVLNTEIERLSRTQLAREKNMRNQGTLVPE